MRLRTAIRLVRSGLVGPLLALPRLMPRYYRVCFLASASSSGLLRRLADGPLPLDRIAVGTLHDPTMRDGLEAWLDFGVAVGVLRHGAGGYALRGRLARALADVDRDPVAALFEEAGAFHHRWIMEATDRIHDGRPFTPDDVPGELVARSSRTVEPFVREAVEDVIPARGAVRLLEIGCGSGIHIRHAAARNPELSALGLELEPDVASLARENVRRWDLEGRVEIEQGDIRERTAAPDFDVATLHNNIYYFPVPERVSVLEHVRGFLRPGGRILLTTACRGGSPTTEILNVWAALTAGCGRLPDPDELASHLAAAGFCDARARRLIPGERFYAVVARR